MAGMFYSLQEVMDKLGKSEDELADLVKEGKLREFRDGPNLLFKVEEVDSFVAEMQVEESGDIELEDSGDEISLESAESKDGGDEISLGGGDTTAVTSEGVSVLGESDADDYKIADDTMAETKIASGATSFLDEALGSKGSGEVSMEEIEEDVNLDSFGSGSGLLDLSLQADDTSLGGILDEIYTPEGEQGEDVPAASAVDVAAEAEQLLGEDESAEPVEAAMAMPTGAVAYIEPESDKASNLLGVMLFIPLVVILYTIIAAASAGKSALPGIVSATKGIIWFVVIGASALVAVIGGAGLFMGGGGGVKTKKVKAKKAKKAKKPKKKKSKKGEEAKAAQEPVEQEAAESAEAIESIEDVAGLDDIGEDEQI